MNFTFDQVDGDALLSIQDVASLLPRRNGKQVHYSTVYRWMTKGIRGRVLASTKIGGARYTTRRSLLQFANLQGRPDDFSLQVAIDRELKDAGL